MTKASNAEKAIGAVLGALALLTVWLAVPIVQNSLAGQRSIDTVRDLRRYEAVPTNMVRSTLTALGDADGGATGDRLVDQAILSLELAQRLPETGPERAALLEQTVELSERRLDRAHGDTHAWARLAYAEYLLNGPTPRSVEALQHSLETGPREYYALWPRFRLGVVLWPFLDEGTRAATLTQAVTAMRADGGSYRLARIFVKLPTEVQGALLAALEGAPGQEDFERFLAQEEERQRRD